MTEAMQERDRHVRILGGDVADDFLQLLLRHRAICVVEDRFDGVSFMVIADDAFEQDIRTVGRAHHAADERSGVDGIVGEVAHPPATGGMNASSSPSRSSTSGGSYDSFTAVIGGCS